MQIGKIHVKMLKTKDFWTPPILDEITVKSLCAIIVGGGPSLKELDFTKLYSHLYANFVIGCNDAYVEKVNGKYCFADWVNIVIFGDWGWYKLHWRDRVYRPNEKQTHYGLKHWDFGTIVTNYANAALHVDLRVKRMQRIKRVTPQAKRYQLAWYHNTGASAIHLACLLGFKRVFLLGFDMKWDIKGHNNWHDNLKEECDEKRRQDHIHGHERLRDDLKKSGHDVEIYNVNPDSALNAWPKITFVNMLKMLEGK